jgi:hypothetical protein
VRAHEQVAAVREQVRAELVGERDRLAAALPDLERAGHRYQAAQAALRGAKQKVATLEATLRTKYSGRLRGWLPGCPSPAPAWPIDTTEPGRPSPL